MAHDTCVYGTPVTNYGVLNEATHTLTEKVALATNAKRNPQWCWTRFGTWRCESRGGRCSTECRGRWGLALSRRSCFARRCTLCCFALGLALRVATGALQLSCSTTAPSQTGAPRRPRRRRCVPLVLRLAPRLCRAKGRHRVSGSFGTSFKRRARTPRGRILVSACACTVHSKHVHSKESALTGRAVVARGRAARAVPLWREADTATRFAVRDLATGLHEGERGVDGLVHPAVERVVLVVGLHNICQGLPLDSRYTRQ